MVSRPELQGSVVDQEARCRPRVRSELVCQVSLGPLREQASGTVCDIHNEGARVRLDSDLMAISGPVELEVEDRRFLAKLAWINGREIGLHFVADLTHEQEDIVHHLRSALDTMKRE